MADLNSARQLGANARARGIDFFSNPFTDPRERHCYGETMQGWTARCNAWCEGWLSENNSRTLSALEIAERRDS